MISNEQLQQLLARDFGENQVVSVYLDTNGVQASSEAVKLQARGLLRQLPPDLQADARSIEQYLDLSYDWSSAGLALFSCTGQSFFETYNSPVAFRNRVRVGHRPYVKPLAHLLDHYAHYGVILVDRVGARFLEYHLGNLLSEDNFTGEQIRKLKRGGGSSAVGTRGGARGGPGGARREEEAAMRNLRDAADRAARFFASKAIRRLLLGGTTETVGQFREMLPKKLQSAIAGAFAIDHSAGEHEVRKAALELLREVNTDRERQLVEKLVASAAAGGSAVQGLDPTLQAVSEKKVETLVVSDGFRERGYSHAPSGFVVANLALSPISEQDLTPVADVVDAAVAYTMQQGGHVEIVADNPKLENIGRIGAFLRY